MYIQWNRSSQKDTCLVISRSMVSQNKSETSSEELSARVVCLHVDDSLRAEESNIQKSETSSEEVSVRAVFLDDSLSAPRSRTWRTCFYLSLVISQPEQNI